jgi:hypothetical protein
MSIGQPFLPGRGKTGGRQKGARNKLSHAFLTDLLEEWTEHGRETLKIACIERPGWRPFWLGARRGFAGRPYNFGCGDGSAAAQAICLGSETSRLSSRVRTFPMTA